MEGEHADNLQPLSQTVRHGVGIGLVRSMSDVAEIVSVKYLTIERYCVPAKRSNRRYGE